MLAVSTTFVVEAFMFKDALGITFSILIGSHAATAFEFDSIKECVTHSLTQMRQVSGHSSVRKQNVWQVAEATSEVNEAVMSNKSDVCSVTITNKTSAGLFVSLDQKTRLGMVSEETAKTFQIPSGRHKIAVTDELLGSEPFDFTVQSGENVHLVANRTTKGIRRKLKEIFSFLGSEKKRRSFYSLQLDEEPNGK